MLFKNRQTHAITIGIIILLSEIYNIECIDGFQTIYDGRENI